MTTVESFYLGADFDRDYLNESPRSSLIHYFASSNKPYLCVGTIEPRKNHNFLLDAFEKIWQMYPETCLCLVGRYGWKSPELADRIVKHPRHNTSLLWFNDLNDTELTFCYKNAKALIFPSFIEGFGLPLVEAMYYNCPVMASDIPIFREVGGEGCAYFSPSNTHELIVLVQSMEKNGYLPGIKKIDTSRWVSWKASANSFFQIIYRHFYQNIEDSNKRKLNIIV